MLMIELQPYGAALATLDGLSARIDEAYSGADTLARLNGGTPSAFKAARDDVLSGVNLDALWDQFVNRAGPLRDGMNAFAQRYGMAMLTGVSLAEHIKQAIVSAPMRPIRAAVDDLAARMGWDGVDPRFRMDSVGPCPQTRGSWKNQVNQDRR